ncbi:MAG: ABC transporter permease [Flavisolibacter sp.]
MKLFLATHNKAVAAEWKKLKHTGTLWLSLGIAFFIPLTRALMQYFSDELNDVKSFDATLQVNFMSFTGFFFPLYLVIITVRMIHMEHRSDTWKLMDTQPVSRFSLFIAKFELLLLLSFFALAAMMVFTIAAGMLLNVLLPKTEYKFSEISWAMHLKVLLRYWVASLSLIAIQYFFSLLLKNFALPMLIGLVAVIAGSILAATGVWSWFPFAALSYTSTSYRGSNTGQLFLPHELTSIIWMLLFLAAGYFYYTKREFTRAFFKPMSRLAASVVAIAFFLFLVWQVNKPVVLPKYGKTIIAGMITAEKPVDKVFITRAPDYDTLFLLPVKNGRFHLQTDDEVPAGIYQARAGSASWPFYFTKGDSIMFDVNFTGDNKLKISGNRIAENNFLQKGSSGYYFLKYNLQNFTPESYSAEVLRTYRSEAKDLEAFKTPEKIKPAEDFISFYKNILAARMLSFLDLEYPKTFAVYHPNENLKYPASANELRSKLSLQDPALLSSSDYLDYIRNYAGTRAEAAENRDSVTFHYIKDSISSAPLRDAVLYAGLMERMNYIRDSATRSAMLQSALPIISQEKVRQKLLAQSERLNKMARGEKATSFSAVSLTGKELKLENLLNRYLVIDLWATWCGPCKREEPFFDELAKRYSGNNVGFISISIDEEKNDWLRDARSRSNRVMQLWASNAVEDFQKSYAVQTIPRFMLIDPRGRIINAQMPPPSDPEFENILEREIPASMRYN